MSAPSAAGARHRLHALLGEFERVLGEEYAALRTSDPDRVQTLCATKQSLVTEIEAASRGLQSPAADEPEAQAEWAAIKGLLGRCAIANRTNGTAIEASRSFVSSLLDVLCGRTAGERVYQANGRLGGTQHGRALERV